jgi:nitroreductase
MRMIFKSFWQIDPLVREYNKLSKPIKIFLNKGREKSVKKLHPWIFSGSIKRIEGEPDPEMDWTTAPVYIILFGDTRTQLGLPMPIRFLYQKRQSIFTSSLASAFLYMHLAATTLGLASMLESGVQNPYVHCLLKDLLGVPPEWEPYDMFIVGYPAQQKRKKLLRNTDRMVHYEKCRPENIRTDDEIKDWIKRARFWTSAAIRRGPKK